MSLIPVRSIPIETHSLPSSFAASHGGFAFCLADPIGSAVDFEQILSTENTDGNDVPAA
jgi:hypothetical protein